MPPFLVPQHNYDPPGRCIYCGNTEGPFGDEHIIPRFMGGKLVLRDGSCGCCERKINSQIETPFGRMASRFTHRVVPARNRDKKRRPESKTIEVMVDKTKSMRVDVRSSEHPRSLTLPLLPPPALIVPKARDMEVGVWNAVHIEDLAEVKKKHGGVGMTLGAWDMAVFSRQLAKIAHSYTAAEMPDTLAKFTPLLPEYILSGKGDARAFIGGQTIDLPPDKKYAHFIDGTLTTLGSMEYMVCYFRLFAFMGAPYYEIVVAERPKQTQSE